MRDQSLWFGVNFKKRIAPISEATAFAIPKRDFHSIAQIIAHLTFWRLDALKKITTGRGAVKDDDPDNFPTITQLESKGWLPIVHAYDQSLLDLIELIKEKDDSFLDRKYFDIDFGEEHTYRFLLQGLLHHDIYHLGQISWALKMLDQLP